ncbi:MAG: zinc transporter ZntB [Sulfitobacter sp.]|jgi:zinc transporter|uniref:zinc transporter ZntB n=1 Tax=Sulfitobacter sp. TaxID=1903071 RepID=UPI000C0DA42A|nr:zinc transporter ZntB [Roseobacter sp.]MBV49393.1 zinc transporter ZntB [Roseobacter sp.]PHR09911.1 MAG: zinc transporter ZntB [Sulfitobacter sp.]|tara:strand:- start:10703 stop:11644 length:942 start_codon:yes stop_codon:yes gene_type:complete
MPLCVFDIFSDGTTKVPTDTQLTGPGAYRWWHFDLTDPMLEPWVQKNLHEIPAGSLIQKQTRPRCDPFESGLILNLRGINMNAGQAADEMVSVRMYVENDLLITVRRKKVFAIDAIRQMAAAQNAPPSPAEFLEELIIRLTLRVQQHVESLDEQAEFFEEDLEDKQTPMPRELPEIRRSVIRLRRYLDPQRMALSKLAALNIPLIPEASQLELREQANSALIAVEELDELRDRLVSVQDEHDANVAQRQARHGYVLSVAAAIFLPLSFITGLFGVNVGGMPGTDHPWAFTVLSLGMLGLAVLMFVVLKLVRWI